MTQNINLPNKYNDGIYLIYDHECLLCRQTAKALRLKKAAGKLTTINARTDHPLVNEIISLGYNLNEGIVVLYQNQIYYSSDAIHLLALLSSPSNFFNRINAKLFKYKAIAKSIYPFAKGIRRVLLFIRRTPMIQHTTGLPTFAAALGQYWDQLPNLFKRRYGSTAYLNQCILLTGSLDITVSPFFKCMSPALRLVGALIPYPGTDVPVDINIISKSNTDIIFMNRCFRYPNRKPRHFNSKFAVTKKGDVIEFMRFGLGVRMRYQASKNCITLLHKGYVWRIFGLNLRVPLSLVLGKVSAKEVLQTNNSFNMFVRIEHSLFGKIFEYKGLFKLEDTQ